MTVAVCWFRSRHRPHRRRGSVATVPISASTLRPTNAALVASWTLGLRRQSCCLTATSTSLPTSKFKSTEHRDRHGNPDGSGTCVDDGRHPNGFEWCINAPAVDGAGNVYVESEDGNIYVLDQGHIGVFTTPRFKLFTNLAVGAAYTPFSIDLHGRLDAQNNGHLFVGGQGGTGVGNRNEGNDPHTAKRFPETDRD